MSQISQISQISQTQNYNKYLNLQNKYKDALITVSDVLSASSSYPARQRSFINLMQQETQEGEELIKNLSELIKAVNYIINIKHKQNPKEKINITSGYRPIEENEKVGGSNGSLHTKCLAVDFSDPKGEIDAFMLSNLEILKQNSWAIEHPYYTKFWCHFQIRLPNSKNNVFIPYSGEPSVFQQDSKFSKR